MAYTAIITKLSNLKSHPNADRLQLATCYSSQIIVSIEKTSDELGIFFQSDGQLSEAFCKANNLFRDTTKNLNPDANPGMFDDNRRIKTQKLRGEKSDGFWIEIHSLNPFLKNGISDIKLIEGTEFSSINGIEICTKYISQQTKAAINKRQNIKIPKEQIIMFKEHFDTPQLVRNWNELINSNSEIIITEKVHGTSHRNANVKVKRKLSVFERILKNFGVKIDEYKYENVAGSRRVVLNQSTNQNAYHDPTIRDFANKIFEGHLLKGETIYSEIVGYESTVPIMGSVDISLIKDKDFSKIWKPILADGKTMTYSYGNEPGECSVYVYRITMTNEDGIQYDYSWDDVKRRCNEIGCKYVPELERISLCQLMKERSLSKEEYINLISEGIEKLSDGSSTLDSRHIKEGVIVNIQGNGLEPKVFKFKSFEFKVLEGIVKDTGIIDEEEANS